MRDGNGNPLGACANNPSASCAPVVQYDPVALTVTLSNPNPKGLQGWISQGQLYKVDVTIPPAGALSGGLRAIDGQTLEEPVEVAFMVSAPVGPPMCTQDSDCIDAAKPHCDVANNVCVPPVISFCDDIQPIFVAKCSAGFCHGAPAAAPSPSGGGVQPAQGLILDTSIGLANTAIGRVSNESNTGALAGREMPPGRNFGVNMPLVDQGQPGKGGDPGNSWLLYKLMLAPPAASGDKCRACGPGPTCLGTANAPGGDGGTSAAGCNACTPQPPLTPQAGMSDAEREILKDYVLGREMPYPTFPGGVPQNMVNDNPTLTLAQLERVRLWIQQGAPVPQCTCQ
jgi:hypothetical protein